ncbi:Pre-mRNA-splicing factor [Pseudogymnoascus destructans]|uniref:Pre-mRNA-splicing factor CWC2 n=1 Tax=Pseudogymnoascus destructans TaxID=655981 RepID=A0A177A2A3_9PEZI|nr:Pre-mRNA-splicing factor [Pseudogymnoascus destructans]OAF55720.1 Pre-mRNA-splicing factor [Pseudogymnoascus destructans]
MAEVDQAPPPAELAQPENDSSEEPSTTALTTTTTEVAAPAERKVKKIIRKKRRPARPQVDPSTMTSEPPPQTGTIFNIWYNKWSGGDREDKYLCKTHAAGRCNIALDSGYTKATSVPGSFFCLFFARGLCPKGPECAYLHRLPGIHDMYSPNVDVFGRDKHSDYRDDMGGVGTFLRQNRTIYIGRIHVTDDIEEVVARHFAEWGPIERTRVLNTRGVAFVTYTTEANAQFAKEAMAHQSLDHEEVLNVRWATADPNPMAQAREARSIEEQAAEAVRRALPAEFVAQIEGRDGEAKKRRRVEGGFGLEGYEAPDEVFFARGANAVNPVGRDGVGLEEEQRMMVESGVGMEGYGGEVAAIEGPVREEKNGIFSKATLAALQGARGAVMTQSKAAAAPKGPLVAYGSDSDSD